jgi:hypothetical protein
MRSRSREKVFGLSLLLRKNQQIIEICRKALAAKAVSLEKSVEFFFVIWHGGFKRFHLHRAIIGASSDSS